MQLIFRRAIHSMILLLIATLVVFLLLHLIPGDPAEVMLGELATPAAIKTLRAALGLDRPLYSQYAMYLTRLVHGDLGLSIRTGRPVLEMVVERLPATFELAIAASAISVAIGIPVGVAAAVRRGSVLETTAFGLSLLGQSVPGFWLGLVLINVFAVRLAWLPVSGRESTAHLVLPAVTLSAFMLGLIVRLTRSTMLDTMAEDFIRTARAKGLSEKRVVRRHALRLALVPVVTVIGLQIGTLLGGAVVTETIFAWPGIGSLAVNAVLQRDYPIVQALILLSALIFIAINFLVDMLYLWMDPRITYG